MGPQGQGYSADEAEALAKMLREMAIPSEEEAQMSIQENPTTTAPADPSAPALSLTDVSATGAGLAWVASSDGASGSGVGGYEVGLDISGGVVVVGSVTGVAALRRPSVSATV